MLVGETASEVKLFVNIGADGGKNVFLPEAEIFIIVMYDLGNWEAH